MRIVIAGGHGQIALRLERLLAGRGDQVTGIIRKPDQAGDLRAAGAEPAVCDLESAAPGDVERLLQGADAAVFAAGAGPGSGAERKDTVDRQACSLLADAAEATGVRRFLVVSSVGQPRAPGGHRSGLRRLPAGQGGGGRRRPRADRVRLDHPAAGPADQRPGHRAGEPRGEHRTRGGHAGRRSRRAGGPAGRAGHGRTDAGARRRRCANRRRGPEGRRRLTASGLEPPAGTWGASLAHRVGVCNTITTSTVRRPSPTRRPWPSFLTWTPRSCTPTCPG